MGYARPRRLDEALALLAERPWKVLAGGTDLFAGTSRPALAGDVLDITAIPELRGISDGTRELRIGAALSWAELVRAALPPAFDGLKAAAREVGSVQIQNTATVGGNLCNASPAADGAPPLLTLDAEVELASARGTRRLPLGGFLAGPRRTRLERDELLTAILVPSAACAGRSAFLKLGARRYLVISIAMAAARLVLSEGRVREAAIAVGACSPVATRLPAIEAALAGLPADRSLAAAIDDAAVARSLAPIDDVRADAAYRRRAAAELVRRAVAAALPGDALGRAA
ncbi:MAG TPA: FAD binding domain-containing protein [Paracoccaceae bacterium]|nr:FAD binding domain-containing protein [Paracoccaceae bacterium]